MNSTTTRLLLLKRHNDVELGKEGQRPRKNCISIIAILQKNMHCYDSYRWMLSTLDIIYNTQKPTNSAQSGHGLLCGHKTFHKGAII